MPAQSQRSFAESGLLSYGVAEAASDAIIVIDETSTIVFVNRATQNMFGYEKEELLGKQLTLLMPACLRTRHKEALEHYRDAGVKHLSWEGVQLPGLHKSGHEITLEISFGEFRVDGKHLFTGICRDITVRKQAEQERERLLAELQAALTKVKLLSGFLPICACCKKVCNDAGYWEQIEVYVRDHSEAEFSHGLCPECVPQFYPISTAG